MLTELNIVLDRPKQKASQSPQRIETSDTSDNETDASDGRHQNLSKKTFRMKKMYGTTELGRFFVTGPTDAVKYSSLFFCRVNQKDVLVLSHGHLEVLRHFQGTRHFARDQRLRLETPVWRVLDFHGNPFCEDKPERQKRKIKKRPLVVRDCKHPFAGYFIVDEAGVVDTHMTLLTKVSCLVDALKIGGSYELVEKPLAQVALTARRVNAEVAWSHDEIVVSSVGFRSHSILLQIYIVVLLSVNHLDRQATPYLVARNWVCSSS